MLNEKGEVTYNAHPTAYMAHLSFKCMNHLHGETYHMDTSVIDKH